MLSPKLIKSLKNIQDPVLRNRYLKYHQSSTVIKETLSSENTNAIIKNLVAKNKFTDDQWGQTSLAVANVMLGELHPRDLERYLEDTLQVDEFVAVEIAKEIKNKILAPIKEDLMKLYPGTAALSASASYAEPVKPIQPLKPLSQQYPQAPHNLPIKPNQSVVTVEKNVVKVGKE